MMQASGFMQLGRKLKKIPIGFTALTLPQLTVERMSYRTSNVSYFTMSNIGN